MLESAGSASAGSASSARQNRSTKSVLAAMWPFRYCVKAPCVIPSASASCACVAAVLALWRSHSAFMRAAVWVCCFESGVRMGGACGFIIAFTCGLLATKPVAYPVGQLVQRDQATAGFPGGHSGCPPVRAVEHHCARLGEKDYTYSHCLSSPIAQPLPL